MSRADARPCRSAFWSDTAGILTFNHGTPQNVKSKSPPCRKKRDKDGAAAEVISSGKGGPAPRE
jgi:hypothetical protein